MDVVIPLKHGGVHEELRYALRSLAAHLPHRRVWTAGAAPAWAAGLGHIPVAQGRSKYRNTTAAMRAACEHPAVSDPFAWSNDDIFVLRPVPSLPVLHQGPVAQVIARHRAGRSRGHTGPYLRGMAATAARLAEYGHPEPLCYELHVPLVVDKEAMLAALDLGAGVAVWHKRTAYGNLAKIGGEESPDCKVHASSLRWHPGGLFVSTSDAAWTRTAAGEYIRGLFPQPCQYELGIPQPGRLQDPAPPRRT